MNLDHRLQQDGRFGKFEGTDFKLPFADKLLHCLQGLKKRGSLSTTVVDTAEAVILATHEAIYLDLASRRVYLASPRPLANSSATLPAVGAAPREKTPGDFVTQMDLLLDQQLSSALRGVKDIPIISEEGPQVNELYRLPQAWLLDPLDGTSAHLCGQRDLCGPMVAYLEFGIPQFSIMLTMDGKRLALAEQGRGAFMVKADHGYTSESKGRFLKRDAHHLKSGTVVINSQAVERLSDPRFLTFWQALRAGGSVMAWERKLPHSMAALAIGEGRLFAVVHDNCAAFIKQQVWDVLPVQLWVEEAGGVFWGFDGRPYDCRNPMPIIVAESSAIAEALLELGVARSPI